MLGCGNRALKRGDGAAAIGDWKRATQEYREALQHDPNNVALQAKYAQVRTQAVTQALARAQQLLEDKQFEAAQVEADYAVTLDEANPAALALQRTVRRAVAVEMVAQATAAAERGESDRALELLARAPTISKDEEVLRLIATSQGRVAAAVSRAADALRAQAAAGIEPARNYPQAIGLLERVAQLDPAQAPLLAATRTQYERWNTAEYDRLLGLGDAALASQHWATAAGHYARAAQLRPGGRADEAVRYTTLLVTAAEAVERREWGRAAANYRAASTLSLDREHYARAQVARVEVQPYRIRLQSVAVKPTRPDGMPWVGPTNPGLARVVGMALGASLGVAPAMAGNLAVELASVPPENLPTLLLEVALPDGRQFRTPAKRGCFVTYDADLVVASNHYDSGL
jgi:tetratricopeptide (TPR) repeat protein